MEEKKEFDGAIEYVVHESILARMERVNRRLFIFCVIIFLALIATNAGWIVYESQFEDSVTISQDVDTASSPAYVNGTGKLMVYGESKANNNKNP